MSCLMSSNKLRRRVVFHYGQIQCIRQKIIINLLYIFCNLFSLENEAFSIESDQSKVGAKLLLWQVKPVIFSNCTEGLVSSISRFCGTFSEHQTMSVFEQIFIHTCRKGSILLKFYFM